MTQGRALGHIQYLEEANKAISMLKDNKIKILKADIFNETTLRHPMPGGILLNLKRDQTTMELHAIEYDQKKIDIAHYMQLEIFVKITKGDICHLPYKDKYFDLVLDFSTIDHIPPHRLNQAFAEYNRVLKDGGLLVLVSWCADIYKWGGTKDHSGFENQYFFLLKDLRDNFQQNFNIIEEEKGFAYLYEDTNKFMYRFLGRKK